MKLQHTLLILLSSTLLFSCQSTPPTKQTQEESPDKTLKQKIIDRKAINTEVATGITASSLPYSPIKPIVKFHPRIINGFDYSIPAWVDYKVVFKKYDSVIRLQSMKPVQSSHPDSTALERTTMFALRKWTFQQKNADNYLNMPLLIRVNANPSPKKADYEVTAINNKKARPKLSLQPPERSKLIEHDDVLKQKDCFKWSKNRFSDKRYTVQKGLVSAQKELSCREITYLVDGHPVKGVLIKPKGMNKNSKLPVLIYNRGGNGNYGAITYKTWLHRLFPIAKEGFIIIASQYRGTKLKNSEIMDEFGGNDVNDVTTLAKLIPYIDGADEKRQGMFGHSRGVMQTFLALKKLPNIKAVSLAAGVFDSFQGLKERPSMERVYKKRIPNYASNKAAELKKRSVKYWVNELPKHVPMLILHGTADIKVKVSHSTQLAKALEQHNIPHKLVLYPDGNHGIWHHRKEFTAELVSWFNTYL